MAKSRYSRTEEKTDDDGKRVFKTTIFRSLERRDSDEFIEVEEARRLDILAQEFYDDKDLWWVIAQTNNLDSDSFFVEAGTRLRIPMNITRVFSQIERVNNNR